MGWSLDLRPAGVLQRDREAPGQKRGIRRKGDGQEERGREWSGQLSLMVAAASE